MKLSDLRVASLAGTTRCTTRIGKFGPPRSESPPIRLLVTKRHVSVGMLRNSYRVLVVLKPSVVVDGHKASVSLEQKAIGLERRISLSQLIAAIDFELQHDICHRPFGPQSDAELFKRNTKGAQRFLVEVSPLRNGLIGIAVQFTVGNSIGLL